MDNTTNTSKSANSECLLHTEHYISYYRLILASIIAIALSMIERKVTKPGQKGVCCGRRPGLPVPVNLLDGNQNRLAYAAAFGCFTIQLLNIFLLGRKTSVHQYGFDIPDYFLYAFTLVLSLEMAFSFYPLFICLSWKCTFVHSSVGLLYSLLWLAVILLENFGCSNINDWLWILFVILMILPNVACNLYLVLRFSYMLAMDVKNTLAIFRNKNKAKDRESILTRRKKEKISLSQTEHLQHVYALLNRKGRQPPSEYRYWQNIKYLRIIASTYQRKSAFRYSPRITATFFVSAICIYQIAVLSIYVTQLLADLCYGQLERVKGMEHWNHFYDELVVLYYTTKRTGVSVCISMVYFFQLFYSYRKNLMLLYKGDFSKIPESLLRLPPTKSVIYCIQYSGTQIAMLICSFILQSSLIFIVCMIVAYFVVLPILGRAPSVFSKFSVNCISGFVTAILFYYFILLLSKKLFVEKRENNDGGEDEVLAIRNRKLHHNITYWLFFFYVVLGMVRCLIRIAKATFLGVLYFGRLDKSIMIQGYESWDTGYMAYVSFIKMELVHCHPVLVVFCDKLLEDLHRKKELKEQESNQAFDLYSPAANIQHTSRAAFPITGSPNVYNRRVRNRWLKTYTLINNPSLQNNEYAEMKVL